MDNCLQNNNKSVKYLFVCLCVYDEKYRKK